MIRKVHLETAYISVVCCTDYIICFHKLGLFFVTAQAISRKTSFPRPARPRLIRNVAIPLETPCNFGDNSQKECGPFGRKDGINCRTTISVPELRFCSPPA